MYCPNCGRENYDDAVFCEFCGTDLREDIQGDMTPEERMRQPYYKEEYVTYNDAGRESRDRPSAGRRKKKSKKGLAAGIIAGILLLGLGGTGTALYMTGFIPKLVNTIMADRYYQSGDYGKAAEYYAKLIEMDGTDEDAYISLAKTYREIGDYQSAVDILGEGQGRFPERSDEYEELYTVMLTQAEGNAGRTPDASGDQGVPAETSSVQASGYDALYQAAGNKSKMNVSLVSTDVSDYPLVRLYLDITDANGTQMELSAPRGAVKEAVQGGQLVEREVKRIEKLEGNEGLSIELVVDKSGSMDSRIGQVKQIMQEFVNSLDYGSGDMAELISFDSYVMYMCTRTNNAELLNNGILNMVATGGTAMYDALYDAVTNAGYRAGARCIIAFTDGEDNESVHTYEEVVRLAQQDSVSIYIIGTDKSAESVLQDIAYSTNGYYWYIDDLANMGMIFDEIYEEQKDLYCFEYMSDSALQQYAERTVDFILDDASMTAGLTQSFTPVETLEYQAHASRYEIIASDISWTDANRACIQKGGHLATITSAEEMDQLIELVGNSGLKYLWIGGYTSVNGSDAFGHWVTGEPFSYTAWYPGEPSRNDADGTPEMYLMMWCVDGVWSWNDQRNNLVDELDYFRGNIGYVCEYEE